MSSGVDHRQIARVITLGRVGLGLGMLVRPKIVRSWLGDAVDQRPVRAAIRTLAVRDLLLALGTLRAADSGEPLRPWVTLAAAADATDAVVTFAAMRSLPRTALGTAALAGGAAAVLLAGRDHLD